jgi:Family of unknown function (DUF6069)
MTTTDVVADKAVQGRWKRRPLVVAASAVAATVVCLIASLATDTLRTPAMNGRAASNLNEGFVFFVALLASLVGWGVLALLEKITPKSRLIWTIIAVVVLLLSLGAPFSGTGISTANRVVLLLLHLTVGAVLIPFLPRRRHSAG